VDCGVLTAPENRRKDNGRTVRLPVGHPSTRSTPSAQGSSPGCRSQRIATSSSTTSVASASRSGGSAAPSSMPFGLRPSPKARLRGSGWTPSTPTTTGSSARASTCVPSTRPRTPQSSGICAGRLATSSGTCTWCQRAALSRSPSSATSCSPTRPAAPVPGRSAPRRCRGPWTRSPTATWPASTSATTRSHPTHRSTRSCPRGSPASRAATTRSPLSPTPSCGGPRELPEFRAHLLTLRFIYIPTQTKQACKLWRAGRAEPGQHRPVVSAIPTLVLTAKWDGIVWPPEGQEIASHLRNSFYFEFPGIAHGTLFASLDGIDCPATIAAAFVDGPRTTPRRGLHRGDAGPQLHTSLPSSHRDPAPRNHSAQHRAAAGMTPLGE
jgi:hypothetical protein